MNKEGSSYILVGGLTLMSCRSCLIYADKSSDWSVCTVEDLHVICDEDANEDVDSNQVKFAVDEADWLHNWAVQLESPWSQADERYVIDKVKILDVSNQEWQKEAGYEFGGNNAIVVEVNCKDAYTALDLSEPLWRCKGSSITTGDTQCEALSNYLKLHEVEDCDEDSVWVCMYVVDGYEMISTYCLGYDKNIIHALEKCIDLFNSVRYAYNNRSGSRLINGV